VGNPNRDATALPVPVIHVIGSVSVGMAPAPCQVSGERDPSGCRYDLDGSVGDTLDQIASPRDAPDDEFIAALR